MPKTPTHFLLRCLAGLACASIVAGLFLLGSQPGAGSLFPAPWDKLAHFSVFATLSLTARYAAPGIASWKILLLTGLVGCADEIHQLAIPGRTPGFDDALADVAGALFGLFLSEAFKHQPR